MLSRSTSKRNLPDCCSRPLATVARYLQRKAGPDHNGAADQLMDELLLQPRLPGRGVLALYHRVMNVHQHKWMYDGESLAELLGQNGFHEIHIYRAQEGELPGLQEIEKPSRIDDGAGVAVEARKPA